MKKTSSELPKPRVAIVGAGIAGLVAAYELAQAGIETTIYEESERPGGRMVTEVMGELVFDGGADFFLSRYELVPKLANEVSIRIENSQKGSTHRIIRGGKAYRVNLTGPLSVLLFRLLSFRARIALLFFATKLYLSRGHWDFFHLSASNPIHDDETADVYLREKVHPEIADYVADAFSGMIQFHRLEEVSLTVAMSLMHIFMTGGFRICYTEGGMMGLPEAIAKKLNVKYGRLVLKVDGTDNDVFVSADGKVESYDAVVVATSGSVASSILGHPHENATRMFSLLRYSKTIVVAFKVRRESFPEKVHMTYVPFVENETIAGYTNESRKQSGENRGEHILLNVYLHESAAILLYELSDEDIGNAVREELLLVCEELRNNQSEIVFHSSKRWEEAMPVYSPSLVRAVRVFENDGQGYRNVYLAGDYLNSVWTEGAARSGKRVADLILRKFTISETAPSLPDTEKRNVLLSESNNHHHTW
ncbi:MAG: hypothetical protein COV07_00695 [Candidatus Vogelbacteria bacterium CG10_big_fil_rev_8_21_14_0_10_45_14]|uniref:Amine oxidase domain-containing protein n=1 Tax=Candidatus Vogelbacteria bacterium CG10_big_fil_rev_8_21_14_0_10_45_14 TaxID=1975042 RepID=A0A2H0RL64_9BACT|nr:MAG: hypothetical protein COV07_00695 [Candidatus Vogelbacteria bacterium CG10_big_fil_rev_8_21_14_0_10_45_14]